MTSEPVGHSNRSVEIQGNTHKAREQAAQSQTNEPPETQEKVVVGKVVHKKTAWWKRMGRSLIADDATSVGDYLMSDVLVPALRNLIVDTITGGTNRVVYGSRGGRGATMRREGTTMRTRYDQMSESSSSRREMSYEARRRHDFGDIVFGEREEAIDVLDRMVEQINDFGKVSVSSLYDFCGITGDYAARRHGWTDLREANVSHHRDGWLLDLPPTESLR